MLDPNTVFPIPHYEKLINVKPTLTNPNIIVGDFTYIADSQFEQHLSHHYDFVGDQLIIGKFCQIAEGVEFMMNGANHQRNAPSTFPFHALGWTTTPPKQEDMQFKGNTVIGNDVWIGENSFIMPGVKIGNGAIIGAKSVVRENVEAYAIVLGNPARMVKKRFDEELIALLESFKWWDKSVAEIQALIPILTSSNLKEVKSFLTQYLKKDLPR